MEEAKTGSRHLQGYTEAESGSKMTMLQLKAALGQSVHLEASRGSREENRRYCTKEDSRVEGPWEVGDLDERPLKRKQTDVAMEMVRSGVSDKDLAEAVPAVWLTFRRSLDHYRTILTSQTRKWKTNLTWYWGPTGTGKTRLAHLLTRRRVWTAPDNKCQWFDGYVGQESVLFDDLDAEDKPSRAMFLRLFDRYPMTVPVKGGFVNWQPRRAFITSNCEPACLFGLEDSAISRRIDNTFNIL